MCVLTSFPTVPRLNQFHFPEFTKHGWQCLLPLRQLVSFSHSLRGFCYLCFFCFQVFFFFNSMFLSLCQNSKCSELLLFTSCNLHLPWGIHIHIYIFEIYFSVLDFFKWWIWKWAVKVHHLLVSKCLHTSTCSPHHEFPCEACRTTARHQRAASGLCWNAKRRVNPVFVLTVSFDKVLSELTYGNLVMTCLHTVISSAFHPYFLGLTIGPIMSLIVNVLHSLLCCKDRHMVGLHKIKYFI